MAAVHLMRAATGRDRHHQGRGQLPRPPRRRAGVRVPRARRRRTRRAAAVGARARRRRRRPSPRSTHVVPFGRLDAVRRVLLDHPGEIAGMIIEPVMMNIGVVPPPPGYLDALAALLHTHGALLTFDEVKTGLTIAPGGATERFGVVPDIVCLAKALGGGVPCGAIGGTAEVMEPDRRRDVRAGRHVQRQPADDGRGQGDAARGAHAGRVRATSTTCARSSSSGPTTRSAATTCPATSARTGPRARSCSRRRASATTATSAATTPATATPTGCTSTTAACSCRRGGRWSSGRCRSSTPPTTSPRVAQNLERFARDLAPLTVECVVSPARHHALVWVSRHDGTAASVRRRDAGGRCRRGRRGPSSTTP